MEPFDLLRRLADSFAAMRTPYLVTGSMASGAYGEPRMTNDIDVVVRLDNQHIPSLLVAFPEPDFYCSGEAALQAIRDHSQFNILHLTTGMKIDVILATESDLDRSRLQRIRKIQTAGTSVSFASPEDVILKKLIYFREGGSEKHLRDNVGILKVQGDKIDQVYLDEWITRLDLSAEWQLVQSRLFLKRDGEA